MVFSSPEFLFAFLPIFMALYFLCPGRKTKNVWLLIASLFFYAWGEPVYVVLMIVSIVVNWVLALALDREARNPTRQGPGDSSNLFDSPGVAVRRRAILIVAVMFNLLVIGFFKYESFLAGIVNNALSTMLAPDLNLPLPIGISFYTLQALSYVIDVYRREVPAQRNVLFLGMYISCFPQLIAGPIVRYQTIAHQITTRKENLADFSSGLRLFIIGLAKKALLANTMAILADLMLAQGGSNIGAVGAWAGIIAYTFQIYFDFSGYSDMAIGLGRMMGFKYLRNFNYPYISRSITEFWRRWHISLSSFFRDYLYIPLGGSRVTKPRWVFNIAVVWAVTGLWHGAAWNFVLWGVYYGALLICEKLFLGKLIEKLPRILQHVYMLAVVIFGWTFFWIPDVGQLVLWWQAMLGSFGACGTQTFWQLTAWEYWPVFLICAVASVPICPYVKARFEAWVEGRKLEDFSKTGIVNTRCIKADSLCMLQATPINRQRHTAMLVFSIAVDLCLLALLVLSILSIVSGSYNPFIYFQF